jgi:hypothetical protein
VWYLEGAQTPDNVLLLGGCAGWQDAGGAPGLGTAPLPHGARADAGKRSHDGVVVTVSVQVPRYLQLGQSWHGLWSADSLCEQQVVHATAGNGNITSNRG